MDGPKYPNQQLRSVSLETFFKGRLSVAGQFDRVQEEFEDRLPNLFVPNAIPGKAIALQPYQLRDNENRESLAVAVNQASYISYAYPGHERFLDEARKCLTRTFEILSVSDLDRVVFRYENEVLVRRREEGTLPLEDVLQVPKINYMEDGDGIFALRTEIRRKWEHGYIDINAAAEPEDDETGDVFRFVIAATVMPAGSASKLMEFAGLAHDRAFTCFEALITDDFRSFIAAEELEEK